MFAQTLIYELELQSKRHLLPVLLMPLHDGVDALPHVARAREVELLGVLDQPGLLQPVREGQLQVRHELLVRPGGE